MKRLYVVLMAICITALVSCFSPWEGGNGTITLTLSDSSGLGISRAGFTPFNTGYNSYEIRLTGPGGIELRETVTLSDEMPPGSRIAQIAVPPGDWIVSVREYHGGVTFERIGFSESVTVRAGQSVGAPVEMMTAVKVDSLDQLTDALTSSNYRVLVLTNGIDAMSDFSINNHITLISDGDFAIRRGDDYPYNDAFFLISNNGSLTLGMPGMSGSITIDGAGIEAANALIYIESGTLVMHSGVTLTGGRTGITHPGSAVSIGDYGSFTMHGGTITGNQGGYGVVFVGFRRVFDRHGGTISGNMPNNVFFDGH
jgi:hypothetical protein